MPVGKSRRKLLTQVLVYVIAAACLAWVFHGTSFGQLKHNLSLVSWPYFVLAAVFYVSVFFANAWRWQILLSPIVRVKYRTSLHAIYVGLFLNEVLPLRPGEIVRCGLLSRWVRELRFPVALSSATIERLVEGLLLQIGFIAIVIFTPMPKSLIYACLAVSVGLVAVSIFLLLAVRRHRAHPEIKSTGRLAEGWRRFVDGLHLMARVNTIIAVVALSVAGLMLNVLAIWGVMRSCRIVLPVTAAAVVFIIVRVGTVVPTTPGSIGAYQFFTVLGLKLFGVHEAAAATFTIIAFGAFTVPLWIVGAIAFILTGSHFSEMSSLRAEPQQNQGTSSSQGAGPNFRSGHCPGDGV